MDEMSCRKGVWKFDTLWNTLWLRVKRHAIHHWLYSLCTERYVEGYCKSSSHHGRLVENTLLIAERNLVCDHPVSQYSISLRTYHF